MNKKFLGLIIVIFLIQPCVKADDYSDAYDEYEENCVSSGDNMFCLDLKASMEYEKADKDLNIAYKKVLAKLAPSAESSEDDKKYIRELKKSFVEAQRQWIIFRNAECNAWSNLNPTGSGRNQITMQCFKDRTIDRTKQLEQWLLEL